MAGSCPTPTGSCYSAAPPQSLLEAPIFGTANQNPAKIHLEVCNANGCDEAAQDVAIQTRAQCFSEVVSDPPVAVGSSPGEVSLSWDPAGGCTEGYFVYFNDDTNIFAIVGSEPGTTFNPDTESGIFNAGNATSFTVLGLVPGKTYYFWIQSYGEGDGQNPTPGGMATVQAGP
jgi:hypothetical protein